MGHTYERTLNVFISTIGCYFFFEGKCNVKPQKPPKQICQTTVFFCQTARAPTVFVDYKAAFAEFFLRRTTAHTYLCPRNEQ